MKIRIAFGGSHRKNRKYIEKLRPFMVPNAFIFPRYQSKILETTVFDTPELRAVLKSLGGTVCRDQPSYLNA